MIETALSAGERVSSLLLVPWAGRRRLPEADALLLHAYALYRASRCPSCGGDVAECTDPGREWEVDDGRTCYRTVVLDVWRETVGKERQGALPAVVPVDGSRVRSSQAALVAALNAS